MEKAFATDEYSKEDLQYVADVLKHCSRKTLFTELPDLGHGGLVLLKPELFSEMICKLS